MNTSEFFTARGANLVNGELQFAAETQERLSSDYTTVSVLQHHGLISIRSTDSLTFLQGQFTCDLQEVSQTQWRYGAHCTHKGRMIANFLLAQTGDNAHLLRLPASTIPALQASLSKFAPFYKGSVEDVSTNYQLLGIAGANADKVVEELFPGANLSRTPDAGSDSDSNHNFAFSNESGTVLRLAEKRYECWVATNVLEQTWTQLLEHAAATGPAWWDLLNIEAGLGEVQAQTVEEWTPHMLNLQIINAISFRKGCYTGQEIVARTHYKGQQKRAMYPVSGTGDLPQPGDAVLCETRNGGEIVMARQSSCEGWKALAVLSNKYLDETLTVNGQALQVLPLPYPLDQD